MSKIEDLESEINSLLENLCEKLFQLYLEKIALEEPNNSIDTLNYYT